MKKSLANEEAGWAQVAEPVRPAQPVENDRRGQQPVSLAPQPRPVADGRPKESAEKRYRAKWIGFFINLPNLLFVATLVAIYLPSKINARVPVQSPAVFIGILIFAELYFLFRLRDAKRKQAAKDVGTFVFAFFLLWELLVTKLDKLPYIFIPAPENVFNVFTLQWQYILSGFYRSMFLLLTGFGTALILGISLGILVGWVPRLNHAVFPITKAISTVPAMIYTPYIVVIMPTFTSASILVIFCGIFWSTFMEMINRVGTIDTRITDSAKVLNVNTRTMLFRVIFPYTLPRIINGLTVSLTLSLMTLTAAEMIGADRGMGYFVKRSLDYANYPSAMAGIFFIAAVITILNSLISLMKKKLIRWNY